MAVFRIWKHMRNQHGYSVSLVKFTESDNMENGFTLVSLPTKDDQEKYIAELTAMTGFEVVDMEEEL